VDLEESITEFQQAIILTPEDHSDLPSQLHNLAVSLDSCFSCFGEDTDLEEALNLYHCGGTLTSRSTQNKYDCATRLADVAHKNNCLSVALGGYSTALSLLSQVAWFGQSVAL
jgi:exonuclease VII small subunit